MLYVSLVIETSATQGTATAEAGISWYHWSASADVGGDHVEEPHSHRAGQLFFVVLLLACQQAALAVDNEMVEAITIRIEGHDLAE